VTDQKTSSGCPVMPLQQTVKGKERYSDIQAFRQSSYAFPKIKMIPKYFQVGGS